MTIRGAPLIGQAAGWGLYLDLAKVKKDKDWSRVFKNSMEILAASRPTGRNLKAALEKLDLSLHQTPIPLKARQARLYKLLRIQEEEWETITKKIAQLGATLLKPNSNVLTICNTGRLATLGRGTAFAIIEEAFRQGKLRHAYALETRPYLQGLRLTAWELKQAKIPHTVITDGMTAHLFANKKIGAFFAGCDRVAANGDTANKIGTHNAALVAQAFKVPVYIACPKENIDPNIASGDKIPIEERSSDEVTVISGKRLAPKGTSAWHPAFDVTPHQLISGIITEEGIWRPNKSKVR